MSFSVDLVSLEISARRGAGSQAILTSRQLLPPPAAEEYLVKRRRREIEEEVREATTRRRNSVTVLSEAGLLDDGELVRMKLEAFTPEQRTAVEGRLADDEGYCLAEWTGLGIRQALRWKHDGNLYSCSGLIWTVLMELGFEPGSVPGPDYWLTPDGRSFYEASCEIEDELRGGSES